jgi:threonine dehydrogenase-like Zn-dependent dehydrogenase
MPREIVTLDGASFWIREYEPAPIGPGEVRVRVSFAAPKHGTESHVLQGSAFNTKQWDPTLRLFVPRPEGDPVPTPVERGIGNIIVGTVLAVGAEVHRFAPGDEVYGYGPIREVHQGPEARLEHLCGLSPEEAVCTDPAHVALVAVRDGSMRVGDAVAVFELGAIGLLTVQNARLSGAHPVLAVDPIATRREAALAMGATAAFDPTAVDVAVAVKEATGGAGVDVALETSGSGGALHEAIRCLRQCGTVVHVPWGPRNAAPLHLDEEFHLNRPTIIGSQAVWQNPDRDHPRWTEARARRTVADLFRRGQLTSRGIVTPIVTFEDAPEVLATMASAPERSIKIGVRINRSEA